MDRRADEWPLGQVDGETLRFGNIVELAGDFFTTYPSRDPITGTSQEFGNLSDQAKQDRFRSAVDSLVSNKSGIPGKGGYLKAVIKELRKQANALSNAHRDGVDPATVYKIATDKYGFPGDVKLSAATLGIYPIIALKNFDHFVSCSDFASWPQESDKRCRVAMPLKCIELDIR